MYSSPRGMPVDTLSLGYNPATEAGYRPSYYGSDHPVASMRLPQINAFAQLRQIIGRAPIRGQRAALRTARDGDGDEHIPTGSRTFPHRTPSGIRILTPRSALTRSVAANMASNVIPPNPTPKPLSIE